MTNLWGSPYSPLMAILIIILAICIVFYLAYTAGESRVARSRRRPGSVRSETALSQISETVVNQVNRILTKRNSDLGTQLELAGLKVEPSEYIIYVGAASFVGLACGVISGSFVVVLMLLLLPPVLGYVFVRTLIGKRRAAFASQLDETAQMLAGSLRTGYSFPQAMAAVSKEADQPTAEEFSRLSNELRVGRPFDEAMETAALRMDSPDFSWIAQAVSINREVGGNLADVLDGVAETIRERAELQGRVKALSAEGKLSAYILLGMPFVVGGVIAMTNPEYVGRLVTHWLGWLMLGVAAVQMVVGAFWMHKMIQIKI